MTTIAAPAPIKNLVKNKSVIPGFGITMGFTLLYLGLIVMIPLGGEYSRKSSDGAFFVFVFHQEKAISGL